jgi:hypothetical protein
MGGMCAVSPHLKPFTFACTSTDISFIRTFRIVYENDFTISCSAFRLDGATNRQGHEETYRSGQTSLLHWVEQIITDAVTADNKHV